VVENPGFSLNPKILREFQEKGLSSFQRFKFSECKRKLIFSLFNFDVDIFFCILSNYMMAVINKSPNIKGLTRRLTKQR